ncbi:MAG: hypothetical protein AAGG46_01640 [Planctomycetota bacterium]
MSQPIGQSTPHPLFLDADQPLADDDTTLESHPTDPPTAVRLELLVRDPEVIRELHARPDGRARHDFALDALRIGVVALRNATAQADADLVRNAGADLLTGLQRSLEEHARLAHERTTGVLKEYFDPQSGRLAERVGRLVSDDGELAALLKTQLLGDGSPLAKTLARHVGGDSPLMKQLDPEQATGLVARLQQMVDGELAKQRDQVLREFSLDNREGSLRRLVDELTGKHGDLSKDLQGKIDDVIKEFSLDKEDSALSRLVGNVERAQRTISSEFSLDNRQSGLSRLKEELLTILSSHIRTNAEFQEEVKITLAKLTQKKQSAAASTEHGNVFEEAVFSFLQNEAQGRGDVAEATGATTGAIKNCKVGDTVVTLGPDTPAAGARVVFEAKDARGYSLGKALDELETARKNRRADVGVFVFGVATAPEGLRPLARFRNDLVVVWDAEDPATDAYLLAAVEIARACSIEFHRGKDTETVDIDGITDAVHAIEKHAANLVDIKKWTGTIQSSSEKILDRIRKDEAGFEKQIALLRQKTAALHSAYDE